MKPFFYMTKKLWQNLNTLGTKRDFKMKQKVFFITSKWFSIKHITQNLFGR